MCVQVRVQVRVCGGKGGKKNQNNSLSRYSLR